MQWPWSTQRKFQQTEYDRYDKSSYSSFLAHVLWTRILTTGAESLMVFCSLWPDLNFQRKLHKKMTLFMVAYIRLMLGFDPNNMLSDGVLPIMRMQMQAFPEDKRPSREADIHKLMEVLMSGLRDKRVEVSHVLPDASIAKALKAIVGFHKDNVAFLEAGQNCAASHRYPGDLWPLLPPSQRDATLRNWGRQFIGASRPLDMQKLSCSMLGFSWCLGLHTKAQCSF